MEEVFIKPVWKGESGINFPMFSPKDFRFSPGLNIIYCHVPEGRGRHKAARPPGRDETRSVNPLVCTQVDQGGCTTKRL